MRRHIGFLFLLLKNMKKLPWKKILQKLTPINQAVYSFRPKKLSNPAIASHFLYKLDNEMMTVLSFDRKFTAKQPLSTLSVLTGSLVKQKTAILITKMNHC